MADQVNRYYQGPPSDHFDGTHFFIPGHTTANCTSDFWKWKLNGERRAWPRRVENDMAGQVSNRVEGDGLTVTFIGHATVLIQVGGVNILTDPFFSKRASPVQFAGPKRVRDPGIALADLPDIDAVLVSHNHYDHMDLPSLRRLHDRHEPRVITPLGNGAIIAGSRRPVKVEEADWGDRLDLGTGVAVHLTPSQHWSKRTLHDRNMALWCAFVIETPGGPVYFAADTGYGEGAHFRQVRERFGPLRQAILPIGAYEPRWFMKTMHMNPEDAVRAYCDLGAPPSLGMHHGTIQLTDEAIDQPVTDLTCALEERDIETARFRTLEPGESWSLPPLAQGHENVIEHAAGQG